MGRKKKEVGIKCKDMVNYKSVKAVVRSITPKTATIFWEDPKRGTKSKVVPLTAISK